MRLLRLNSLDIVHVGHQTYPLAKRIRAVAGQHILTEIEPLGR